MNQDMTSQEFRKLVDIIETKFYEIVDMTGFWISTTNWQGRKAQKWKKLLGDLEIEYVCRPTLEQQRSVGPHTTEVRVIDPVGNILRLTQDQVKKILVIGL
jgi:hypothetical protein